MVLEIFLNSAYNDRCMGGLDYNYSRYNRPVDVQSLVGYNDILDQTQPRQQFWKNILLKVQ